MKKLLICMVVLLATITAVAQTKTVYCMVESVPTNLVGMGSKCQIQVDFGQGEDIWKGGNDNFVVDDEGKVIKFNSIVEALNYMVNRGWRVHSETVLVQNNQKFYHWLMEKEISPDEDVSKGVKLKGFKKEEKGQPQATTKKSDYDPLYN